MVMTAVDGRGAEGEGEVAGAGDGAGGDGDAGHGLQAGGGGGDGALDLRVVEDEVGEDDAVGADDAAGGDGLDDGLGGVELRQRGVGGDERVDEAGAVVVEGGRQRVEEVEVDGDGRGDRGLVGAGRCSGAGCPGRPGR